MNDLASALCNVSLRDVTTDLLPLDQARDAALVGGKAVGLAQLLAAGLPVPPGFCVTTMAHRRHGDLSPNADLRAALTSHYHALGGGRVAVRSSAADEDGATHSFAGQQDTYLNVHGDIALIEAVARCWDSLRSARAQAYRARQGTDREASMGVVVQRQIEAEVAGVLFTRDPVHHDDSAMLVEASWGLGESVVSGRVVPDRFRLDHETGQVRERQIGDKTSLLTADGHQSVPEERRRIACLNDEQLAELADLGRRVETHFGSPRDLEWAWADGRFWLLQARPITAGGHAERDRIRAEEIERLCGLSADGQAIWVRINLSESLPEATPMTWAVVQRRLMAGTGGLGLMMRDLGYRPSDDVAELGAFDLVAGRVMCNLAREPLMSMPHPPVWHDPAKYRAQPGRSSAPATDLKPLIGWSAFWRLFRSVLASGRVGSTLRQCRRDYTSRFRERILPPFLSQVEMAAADDLTRLSEPELIDRFEQWTQRTLVEFARESLKATALLEFTRQELRTELSNLNKQPGGADQAISALAAGAKPDDYTVDLAAGVQALAESKIAPSTFLERFGHRGDREMELAAPRWGEDPASPARLAARAGSSRSPHNAVPPSDLLARLTSDPTVVPATRRRVVETLVTYFRTLTGLREESKHHLLRGYALMRSTLVELARRHGLGDDIFFLKPEELPRLARGENLSALAQERRRRHEILLGLPLPGVIFGDELEVIGRPPPPPSDRDTMQGVGLSGGVAEGPALVLRSADDAPTAISGYVLVCPSTDPAWVPLFVNARALVMETGGVLSHGAIVAREFGLPAVAGLSGVVERLRTGQQIRVDGTTGSVTLLTEPKA